MMSMKRAFGVLMASGLVLGAFGCVMPDQLSQMQKDLADVRLQLHRVQKDQTEALNRLDQLEAGRADDDRVTRADLADLELLLREVSRDVAVNEERTNDLARQVDRLSQEARRARSMTPPRPGPRAESGTGESSAVQREGEGGPGLSTPDSAEAIPDPEALYNTAYADFSKGNYALAISGFEEYNERFPASAQSDNALYWVGECYFSQGNFAEAIRAFDRMLERYPDSDKAAAANLKKGLAFLEENQIGQAIVQLRFVQSKYPVSDEAKIARDKLVSLGAAI
jgi:tol-pal system protein YbgF